jgi:hypothetical protein
MSTSIPRIRLRRRPAKRCKRGMLEHFHFYDFSEVRLFLRKSRVWMPLFCKHQN